MWNAQYISWVVSGQRKKKQPQQENLRKEEYVWYIPIPDLTWKTVIDILLLVSDQESHVNKWRSLLRCYQVDFIIDIGASVKIIYKEQWEELKRKQLKCYSEKCGKNCIHRTLELLGEIPKMMNRIFRVEWKDQHC